MRILKALLTLHFAACCAEVSSGISLSNGVRLTIIADSGNAAAGPLKVELKPASGNSVFRVFRDETGLVVYAYELAVERLPDGEHFQIIARPAGDRFAAMFPDADGGKPVPSMSKPLESRPLGSGGRFTVEVPTNPGLAEHRTDTVQILFGGSTEAPSTSRLRFVALKISINGKPVPIHSAGSTVSGQYAMFYIPGRGAYYFSTEQVEKHPFIQAGTVDGTRLQFTIDNESYDCSSKSPILVQTERGPVWVYRDPDFKPVGNLTKSKSNPLLVDEFFTAASDSLDWWLP